MAARPHSESAALRKVNAIRRRRAPKPHTTSEVPRIVHLWLLRLLVPLGGHKGFISEHGFGNDAIAEAIGLGGWIDTESQDFDPKSVRAELRKLHQLGERKYRNAAIPTCLSSNIGRLSELVGMSEVDCRILEFAVLIQNERILEEVSDQLGQMPSVKAFNTLSVLLSIPENDIRSALSAQGILAKSGLLTVDRSGVSTLRWKLELLSDTFADLIVSSEADPVSLLRDNVVLSEPAQLGLEDYAHINSSLALLRPYLKKSIESGRKGVNIFMHGDPGTGKTQLARVLAKELGCELFEVSSEDGDGDPVGGMTRLRSFRAAQSFFAQRKAIILFDEVEDVFDDGNDIQGRRSTAKSFKSWINRMLEENTVPTLWLSNSIGGLDPAFIRRFDMVFELPIPSKKQRERILRSACAGLLDTECIVCFSEAESLAPAVVTKAASVVATVCEELGQEGTAAAFELLISNALEAQGNKPVRKYDPNRLPDIYDPVFIHADSDLAKIAAGLSVSKSGRMCLYGPPGTGKTAYGRWLAEQLDMPLLVKRASDLMSKWVGQNEKNIAMAFREAEQEGALLLIDEVDSFLQDRRGAQRSWEITQVNEMLTQMESFSGVFIASTNLMQGLDQASLRRFDLKVKFDFLRPEQASELFSRYCTSLKLPKPESDSFARIKRMDRLTPGDFAAVIRQRCFLSIETPAKLVAALEAECAIKEASKPSMGFLQ